MTGGVRAGVCVPVFANPGRRMFRTPGYASLDAAATMAYAVGADRLGYDSLWVADHLMLGAGEAILEGWTVLAGLATATRRCRLGIIHQSHYFRHPGIVANMAATIDRISGGRFVYFVDYGLMDREHGAYGIARPDGADERAAEVEEGIEVCERLWAGGPVDFDGRRHRLRGAVCAPAPVQRPHPPIWIGEDRPAMLRVAARHAQGWNTTPVSVEGLRERLEKLAAACAAEERPYDSIEKSAELQVLVAADEDALRRAVGRLVALARDVPEDDPIAAYASGAGGAGARPALPHHTVMGTPDEVAAGLGAYVAAGASHFLLWFLDAPEQDGMALFAERVLPALRGATVSGG